ncbi:hypothetical protein Rleg9DRAFT_6536 [Rhizobium leguminosarum bv. trifolii WSM597]|uniref:Uncharacterized protein n=1 Tax=Rhizobium leguminosarum bv. trifolii WSM597 TaxID=754764 RepID=I9NL62_RHILT|nr:hypothetical protein [Rhizobium leguminosarum]EJB07522.1 hypothetical protein Rleg9DRAFT_6536 [Rhizobium leguminosarum bv. trifolii WSM597]
MSAADFVPFFTIPGSVIGVVTGAFVIWERFFRYQPMAFIIAKPLIPGGAQKACYLRVINRSERPIFVSWPTGIEDNALRIAADHSSRAIVKSLLHGEKAVVLDGGEDATFPVLKPRNWEALEPDQTIETIVRWRFAQPMTWKRDRTFLIRISKRSYLLLTDEVDNDVDD